MRRNRGQHVALQQQAAQHGEVARFHRGNRRCLARRREEPFEQFARWRAVPRERPGRLPQCIEVDALRMFQRMAGACDHRDAVLEERLLLQVFRLGGAAQCAEDEVDVAAAQRCGQRVVRTFDRGHVQPRMPREQRGNRERQDLRAAERQRPDGHAALQRALARGNVRSDVAQLREHALEVKGHDLAGQCRHEAARLALEQRGAEPALQVLQRAADGRLRDAEFARDGGHVALLDQARNDGEPPAVEDRGEERWHVGGRADAAARDELRARILELALDAARAHQHQFAV
jgi:hypothetical protein